MLVSLRELELTAFNHHSPLTAQCPKEASGKIAPAMWILQRAALPSH